MNKAISLGIILATFFIGTTQSTNAQIISRTLNYGMVHDEVGILQDFLKTYPEIYPEGWVTKYFGKLTLAAVKKFQEAVGIEPIGTVGPKTREKINDRLFAAASATGQVNRSKWANPATSATPATPATPSPGQAAIPAIPATPAVPGAQISSSTPPTSTTTPPIETTTPHSIQLSRASGQYLYIPNVQQIGLGITGNMTVEAWVNLASEPPCNSGYPVSAILDKSDFNGRNLTYRFFLRTPCGGGDDINFFLSPDGSSSVAPWSVKDTTNRLGSWIYYAAVYTQATQSIKFYVNGQLRTTTQQENAISQINNNREPFYIGIDRGAFGFFDGKLDEVRVWNVARSATEIANNYKKELGGMEPGLVGYWKFDNELVDGKMKDSSGHNNHLILVNAPTFSTDAPSFFIDTPTATSTPIATSTLPNATSTPSTATSTSPVFSPLAVGDRVVTIDNLNVRATSTILGIVLGVQPLGSLGTLVGGPASRGSLNWWLINYDNGVDGWSVENYLLKVSTTSPSQ